MASELKLKIITYNCYSVRKNVSIIRDLLDVCDILVCQETILLEEDKFFLDGVDENFDYVFISSELPRSAYGNGRPKGGMVIFYTNKLDIDFEKIYISEHFGFYSVKYSNEVLFDLGNVYLPYDDHTHNSLIKFQCALGEMQSVLDDLSNSKLLLLGDFNADPNKGRFWRLLCDTIESRNLTFRDLHLSRDNFTYLSEAHNTTSWLDHVISSANLNVSEVKILYDFCISDHFPITATISLNNLNLNPNFNTRNADIISEFINWHKFDSPSREEYNNVFLNYMKYVPLCNNENCTDISHKNQLNSYYNDLKFAMKLGTEPFKIRKSKKFIPIPGWNANCKYKHNLARIAFLNWVRSGKIRYGSIYDNMKMTRKSLKNALDYCKNHENEIRNENFLHAFQSGNSKLFWKEVKKRRGLINVSSDKINGKTDPFDIAEDFRGKFSLVSGSVPSIAIQDTSVPNNPISCNFISLSTVKSAISKLKTSLGFDGLHSNHLKNLNEKSLYLLRNFIRACLNHCFIPPSLLKGTITPIPKNRTGNLEALDNYREIMISNVFYKFFEYCLLPILQNLIPLSSHQFAYRENCSTILATCIFKECVEKYLKEKSNVYSAFLDMSRAFERVNHQLLINKLSCKGLPENIVNFFEFIFKNTSVSVYFKGSNSIPWMSRRGVRQGGVTSAYLFCIYIDDILTEISKLPSKCKLGISNLNIQAYADDIVVFCPIVLMALEVYWTA